MKNIFLLFGISLFSNNVISQSIFRSKEYGFEMQYPNNWKQANNSMLLDNLEKFEVNEENNNQSDDDGIDYNILNDLEVVVFDE